MDEKQYGAYTHYFSAEQFARVLVEPREPGNEADRVIEDGYLEFKQWGMRQALAVVRIRHLAFWQPEAAIVVVVAGANDVETDL